MGSIEDASVLHPGPLEIVVFAATEEPLVVPLPSAGRLSIGRAEDNEVRIDHASVSRKHAVLHVGPRLRVEDTGSSNGTFVCRREERSLSADTRKVLRLPGETFVVSPGDCIVLGSVFVLVRRAQPASSGASGLLAEALPEEVVVHDPQMRKLYEQARDFARASLSVLLLGETGVGKEVLARAIHESSSRSRGPFVAIHCASLSESLLESELFGHKKGSFTGAVEDKKGMFEAADKGTVFLDEIGELSLQVQVKLLRVLEDRTVLRVGDRTPRPVDIRFVAATNRELDVEITRGTFREDLYYRLSGAELTVPPLRERQSEILPLARHFLAEACRRSERASVPSISKEAAALLLQHGWRGNVRELKNAMDRAAVLCVGPVVSPEHLPTRVLEGGKPNTQTAKESAPARSAVAKTMLNMQTPGDAATSEDKKAEEKKRILETLEQCAGNQTRAAELLGMSRRTLVSRLEEYDLPRPRKK